MRKPLFRLPLLALPCLLPWINPAWSASNAFVAADLTGKVVDAETRQSIRTYAVIQANWMLRPAPVASKTTKAKPLYARQVQSGPGGTFEVPAWIESIGPGWVPVSGQNPIVRIYAKGYHRLVVDNRVKTKISKPPPSGPADIQGQKWTHEGEALAMKPLLDTKDALAKELAVWKKDLDTEINQSLAKDRQEAIRQQEKLLFLLVEECKALPEARRKGVCPEAGSELGVYLAQAMAERSKYLIVEDRNGEIKKYPIKVLSAPSPQAHGSPIILNLAKPVELPGTPRSETTETTSKDKRGD